MLPPKVSSSTKTAFLTGASGFLGLKLAGLLREFGWRVGAISSCRVTIDSSRAQRDLGYRPSTFAAMVRNCVASMRSGGRIPAWQGWGPAHPMTGKQT